MGGILWCNGLHYSLSRSLSYVSLGISWNSIFRRYKAFRWSTHEVVVGPWAHLPLHALSHSFLLSRSRHCQGVIISNISAKNVVAMREAHVLFVYSELRTSPSQKRKRRKKGIVATLVSKLACDRLRCSDKNSFTETWNRESCTSRAGKVTRAIREGQILKTSHSYEHQAPKGLRSA